MKKTTRFLSILLAAALLVSSLAACGKKGEGEGMVDELQTKDYEEQSSTLYQSELGAFLEIYQDARAEKTDVNLRFAKMAVAEAKLMEAAVMFPTTSKGGTYGVSRVAPYTVTPCYWGNDQDRRHQSIVTTEFITKEDIAALKAIYGEKAGTGTYEQAVKDYLTEKGYTITDEYGMPYTSDPQTWDIMATSRQADTEPVVYTYDGLYEYDVENVQQPALAESVEISEDGLTYTFKIKSGLVWTDSQGRKVADVKADDFVAGMNHLFDAKGGVEWLVQPVIVGADDYINGKTTDFSTVGVKAPDDTTLVYTLVEPCPYFMSMLGYTCFAPMSREYYESQGGKFGEAYDNSAADYTYGKDPDHIAYCGPYLITGATPENSITFKANPTYWNKDNINIKTFNWLFNDGSDATKAYKDAVAGTIVSATLNASALELAKADGNFDKYGFTSRTDATSFMGFLNVNRAVYANVADETAAVSEIKGDDAVRSNMAMRNSHFRRAICFGLDRGAYNAQSVGEDLKLTSIINSYTPGTFVKLTEDTTVSINGTDKTFPAGTYYGEIMQAQIDADGVKMKVWDPNGDDGIGSSSGFDGWYNPTEAAAELDKAIEELAKEDVKIDEENPIYLDLPYLSSNEVYTNKANSFKQSVEASLGGKVIINLIGCADYDAWLAAGYNVDSGKEANYSIYDVSGWGPDYGDPSTYLDTFLPDYAGYMVKCIGLY